MQITVIKIKLRKLIDLFTHFYGNHNEKNNCIFFIVVKNIQNSAKCQIISVEQPSTYQCKLVLNLT